MLSRFTSPSQCNMEIRLLFPACFLLLATHSVSLAFRP